MKYDYAVRMIEINGNVYRGCYDESMMSARLEVFFKAFDKVFWVIA